MQDTPRAVQLFGRHDAHQRVRQREFGQRPFDARALQARFAQAVGAADEQRHVTSAMQPVVEVRGQLFGAPLRAAHVERDDQRILGNGRRHARAFVVHGARDVGVFAALAGRDFHEI